MIHAHEVIDHNSAASNKQYQRAYNSWYRECAESVLSKKQMRGGGRVRRRAIERAGCEVSKNEQNNVLKHVFSAKGRTIGVLEIKFKNFSTKEDKPNGD